MLNFSEIFKQLNVSATFLSAFFFVVIVGLCPRTKPQNVFNGMSFVKKPCGF